MRIYVYGKIWTRNFRSRHSRCVCLSLLRGKNCSELRPRGYFLAYHTVAVRAGHWLTESGAIILSSKSTDTPDCSSILVSPLYCILPKHIQWVSVVCYGVFLRRTYKMKVLANMLARSISILLLPQCLALVTAQRARSCVVFQSHAVLCPAFLGVLRLRTSVPLRRS